MMRRPLNAARMLTRAVVVIVTGALLLVPGNGVGQGAAHTTGPRLAASPIVRTVPIASGSIDLDAHTGHGFVIGAAKRGTDHFVSMLDARSGLILHTLHLPGAAFLAVSPATDRVFVVQQVNPPITTPISVLDARGGGRSASVSVPGYAVALAVGARGGQVFVLTVGNANAAHPNPPGWLSRLDGRTGRRLWTVQVANPVFSNLAVADQTQRVFVSSFANVVTMLDARTGHVLRTIPGGYRATVTVDERRWRVFVGSGSGLMVLDAETGAVVRTTPTAEGIDGLAVAEQAGHVFATLPPGVGYSGTVDMFDAATGALRRVVSLGRTDPADEPAAIAAPAIAERMGRVYLLMRSPQPDEQSGPSGPGAIAVLDATTGAILRPRIRLDDTVVDGALVLDEQTQRLFVRADNVIVVLDTTRL